MRARILKRHEDEKENVCINLVGAISVSLTTDTWTSTATDSYITVTEHHITENWEMESNVLIRRDMRVRHAAENIAKKLEACTKEFGLVNKVECCVHDNARNMECASELCPQWPDLRCFAHTLQLCVNPALDIPQVAKVVGKCRKLVGYFKHSTTLTAKMWKRQKLLDVKEHALIRTYLPDGTRVS